MLNTPIPSPFGTARVPRANRSRCREREQGTDAKFRAEKPTLFSQVPPRGCDPSPRPPFLCRCLRTPCTGHISLSQCFHRRTVPQGTDISAAPARHNCFTYKHRLTLPTKGTSLQIVKTLGQGDSGISTQQKMCFSTLKQPLKQECGNDLSCNVWSWIFTSAMSWLRNQSGEDCYTLVQRKGYSTLPCEYLTSNITYQKKRKSINIS